MKRPADVFHTVKGLLRERLRKGSAAARRPEPHADQNPRFPKIIWCCWFQGWENAPSLVKKCFSSWQRKNPGWDFRCLDATTIEQYVPIRQYIDLDRQRITAASLSDIVRILLLHDFGGVWVDATLFCNQPLDEWLPGVMGEGFFGFRALEPVRPVASWFLSAERGSYFISTWCRWTVEYWSNRTQSDDYFWFLHMVRGMCETDPGIAEIWSRIPKIGVERPHALQIGGEMYRPAAEVRDRVDWATPVFKLTHRVRADRLKPGSMLEYLLQDEDDSRKPRKLTPAVAADDVKLNSFASLKVSTENLGDHIQIIAGLRLLSRLGVTPTRYIDRDNEIRSAPGLHAEEGSVGLVLNGWFKTNGAEWPPHPKFAPLIYSFHAMPFFCPELVSDASIDYFRRHQPIGCRDIYTGALLQSKGVDTFVSNCISLTLPRRINDPTTQSEVFVVSRDERIRSVLPPVVGPYTFICQYSGSNDFEANMARAEELLVLYRSRARLIITTMLHCALPAIAMGIPVVVFYPINHAAAHARDRDRFSSLERLVAIYRFGETESVDWDPQPVDIGEIKLRVLDGFYEMAARWQIAPPPALGPMAPAHLLPAPEFG
jgi:hypothetical protein